MLALSPPPPYGLLGNAIPPPPPAGRVTLLLNVLVLDGSTGVYPNAVITSLLVRVTAPARELNVETTDPVKLITPVKLL